MILLAWFGVKARILCFCIFVLFGVVLVAKCAVSHHGICASSYYFHSGYFATATTS